MENGNDFSWKTTAFLLFRFYFNDSAQVSALNIYTQFLDFEKENTKFTKPKKPNQGIKYVITKTLEVYSFAFLLFFLTLWHVSENGTQNL
ncbi:hypothetical protein BWX39_00060 [Prevotella intermedia ATCC 25611 = DSM 20706]|nr:hypothetical protein BWX39_00060 [Prevotella intermedia ATCC 25611 = DSM 20706]